MDKGKKMNTQVAAAVDAIIEQIAQRPLHEKTIDRLVAGISMSRKSLQQGFKERTGMGIKEYQLIKRMEVARRLLEQCDKSVKEIAFTCHYTSQQAFTRAFKKMTGLSPKEYQDQHLIVRKGAKRDL
jgi:AraC-like DNA-binding protein